MATLKSLTTYDDVLTPNTSDIRTEYLDPITQNTYKYTFRLDQAGYLDTNSMLIFKLKGLAADNEQRVNMWNGALGAIKRVIFQVGDNIINDVQDVYKYSTLKNMNMPPSMRNGYLGHYLGNQMWTQVRKSTGETIKADTNSNTYEDSDNSKVGAIVLNPTDSGAYLGKADGSGGAFINSHSISTNAATNPQYGIPLGMLIPALKGQKIPLFLFDKQRILLTFEFNTSDNFCNNLTGANVVYNGSRAGDANFSGDSITGTVIPFGVKLVVDYIIVPSDIQNQIVAQTQKQGGYQLEFYDVVNIEKNLVGGLGNNTEQSVEHRIGQNNREVHNIIMWKDAPKSSMALTGDTGSSRGSALMLKQGCLGFSQEEFNVNVDGRDEFDHFVYNPVSQYNEISNVVGADLKVERPFYCVDDNTAVSELAKIESGILGTFKPLALSLRSGQGGIVGGGRMIGNYPIIWKYKRQAFTPQKNNVLDSSGSVKCNYFCEVSRTANILNTPAGTNVVVSY